MEKSCDLESQIAKVEENLVLILESMNKDKEEVIPEGKRLDLEARIDFVEKLVRKIKVVGFNITDENQNQYNSSFNKEISKKLGKLRIESAAEEEKEDQIKLMKEQFEEFAKKFEKQMEDQQKINEELKKQMGEFEKKQKKLDQYLAASRRPITTAQLGNIRVVTPTATSTTHLGNIKIETTTQLGDIEVESRRESRVEGGARPIKRLNRGSEALLKAVKNYDMKILVQRQQLAQQQSLNNANMQIQQQNNQSQIPSQPLLNNQSAPLS
ncbi:janus kinase and microtubule interacting protein 1-like protein [Corchorus olitorius]|uniref:Janus kinase and microtubule interacting protein 1-like protein n=1 Tax=Corchorus olitorius TaxID=93759 RepID=A0A1R3HT67_9ROSI|nr:janus kinase and microtubule interacting protein 1-like protein [Corchorus olitorius]